MREILFRGKRLDGNGWTYGDLSYHVHDGEVYVFPGDGYDSPDCYEVDPSTVGQYTGLTDKNGVKIFEGDIVAWRREDIVLTGHYTYGFGGYRYGDELVVSCLESGFMLCQKHDGMIDIPNANSKIDNYAFWNFHRFLEVIGNIHDNPEMLK